MILKNNFKFWSWFMKKTFQQLHHDDHVGTVNVLETQGLFIQHPSPADLNRFTLK